MSASWTCTRENPSLILTTIPQFSHHLEVRKWLEIRTGTRKGSSKFAHYLGITWTLAYSQDKTFNDFPVNDWVAGAVGGWGGRWEWKQHGMFLLTQARHFLFFSCCHSTRWGGSEQTFTSDPESKINHFAFFLSKRREKINLVVVKISKKSCWKTKGCELLKSSGLEARAVLSLCIPTNHSLWRLTFINCRYFPLLSKQNGND